jgi:hypothetical protein
VAVAGQGVLDEVGQDPAVGLGATRVPLGLQLLLELEVVLENAVVDDDERAAAVGVRVSVLLGRTSVGRQARVADSDRAAERLLTQKALQRLKTTGCAPDMQHAVLEHGDPGRGCQVMLRQVPVHAVGPAW